MAAVFRTCIPVCTACTRCRRACARCAVLLRRKCPMPKSRCVTAWAACSPPPARSSCPTSRREPCTGLSLPDGKIREKYPVGAQNCRIHRKYTHNNQPLISSFPDAAGREKIFPARDAGREIAGKGKTPAEKPTRPILLHSVRPDLGHKMAKFDRAASTASYRSVKPPLSSPAAAFAHRGKLPRNTNGGGLSYM